MLIDNIKELDLNSFNQSLLKSLTNFCNKSPLNLKITIVDRLIILSGEQLPSPISYTINYQISKKENISNIRELLEIYYPIIPELKENILTEEEVRVLAESYITQGMSTTGALDKAVSKRIQKTVVNRYKVIRRLDFDNEINVYDLLENKKKVFSLKTPVTYFISLLFTDPDKAYIIFNDPQKTIFKGYL